MSKQFEEVTSFECVACRHLLHYYEIEDHKCCESCVKHKEYSIDDCITCVIKGNYKDYVKKEEYRRE